MKEELRKKQRIQALALARSGEFGQAEKIYLDLIDINDNCSGTYSNLGAIYLATDRNKDAVEMLKKALTLNSNDSCTLLNLARSLANLNDFDEAINQYKKALKLSPNDPDIYFHLGNALLNKDDRKNFESKWNDMKLIVEYGMLSDEKFYDRASDFYLYPNVDGSFFTMKEFSEKIKDSHKDKDGKVVYLYASDKSTQHSYIAQAKERGLEVLLLDSPIISHLVQKFESKIENSSFVRVDSDSIENLIKQEVSLESILSEKEKDKLKPLIEEALPKEGFSVVFENLPPTSSPFSITISEFMRRMKEMSMTGGGGMMGMQNMPDSYNLIVNTNHKLTAKILKTKGLGKKKLIQNAINLALLSQNLLKGEALTNYISNSFDNLKS